MLSRFLCGLLEQDRGGVGSGAGRGSGLGRGRDGGVAREQTLSDIRYAQQLRELLLQIERHLDTAQSLRVYLGATNASL